MHSPSTVESNKTKVSPKADAVPFSATSQTRPGAVALRQQLAVLKRKQPRPKLDRLDRLFWMVLRRADLVAEAEALWKAVQPGAAPGRIADYWGCVALLCNPDRTIPGEMLKAWAERVAQEPGYGNVSYTQAEGRLINQDGLLLIDWPRLVEGGDAVPLDLLLVTANDPEISATRPNYPNVNQIAGAWNVAASRYAEYFWRNTDNGIRTFEDDQIRVLLHPREPGRV